MSDDTALDEEKTNLPRGDAAGRFAGALGNKRRRFLTGGLAAVPLLASLESRNALAVDALLPSDSLSGNISQVGTIGTGVGVSPVAWAAGGSMANSWPSGVDKSSTDFHGIFAKGANADFGTTKLKATVAYTDTSDPKQIAAYFSAAYLNIMKGLVNLPGLDKPGMVTLVQHLWSDWATTGSYKVNSTVSWNGNQIKTYLTSNGIVAVSGS